jgi:N-acetylglutamate synthase-like GNAT family acetyltransferase
MHVPKELIEQVRDRAYEVEDWYKYQELICLRQTPNGPQLNPLSMLYVIADEGNKVVGMLWAEVDALGKTLVIQTFSMDKRYWVRGKAVELLAKKGKEIAKECKLKVVKWLSNYPKHSERYGFKRSKTIVMEWRDEDDITEENVSKDENENNYKDVSQSLS